MPSKMTKRGQADNEITYEYICDTLADLNKIDPHYITMGSVATVIEGESGFEVYMANSQKKWVNLGSGEVLNKINDNQEEPTVNYERVFSGPDNYDNNNTVLNNFTFSGNIGAIFAMSNIPCTYFGVTLSSNYNVSEFVTLENSNNWFIAILLDLQPEEAQIITGTTDDLNPLMMTYAVPGNAENTLGIVIPIYATKIYIFHPDDEEMELFKNNSNNPKFSEQLKTLDPVAIYDISNLNWQVGE